MTRAVTNLRVAGISLLVVPLVALLALAAPTADARPATPAFPTSKQALPRSGPPYEATLLTCRRSPQTERRSATVGAAMRPIAGASRLALKVELLQRSLPSGRWSVRTDVPGLGVWTPPSDPTIGTRANDVFKYRQTVGRLVVPSAYRFEVTFRWYDAAGAVVREESAATGSCHEPDLRPNLTLVRVDVEPHRDPQLARYVVLVKNSGRAAAASVGVGRVEAGSEDAAFAPARTIGRLRPQEMSEVTLTAPACVAGSEPVFVVDPGLAVEESDETDNALRATCPATLRRP